MRRWSREIDGRTVKIYVDPHRSLMFRVGNESVKIRLSDVAKIRELMWEAELYLTGHYD